MCLSQEKFGKTVFESGRVWKNCVGSKKVRGNQRNTVGSWKVRKTVFVSGKIVLWVKEGCLHAQGMSWKTT